MNGTALPPVDVKSVERILIVCLDNLGDLVFTSALLPPIRERFPNARITLLCKDYASGIAPLVPGIDAFVACDPFWDRAPGRAKGSLLRFVRTLFALRRENYDLAVITSPQWRAAASIRMTGARIRLAQERRKNRKWLTHVLAPADSNLPVLVDHAHFLDALGIAHGRLAYALERAPIESERRRIAKAIGVESFVALHPFASDRARCVALREWLAVAEALASRGECIVWVGSRAELDEVRAAESTAGIRRLYADALTAGTLRETAALLSLASLFVGHDSGPLHIANAFGVASLGIFAPGQPKRTFPQGIGPSRVLFAPTPREIDAAAMLENVDALLGVAVKR